MQQELKMTMQYNVEMQTLIKLLNDHSVYETSPLKTAALLGKATEMLKWSFNYLCGMTYTNELEDLYCECAGCHDELKWGDGSIMCWTGDGRYVCPKCFAVHGWSVFDTSVYKFDRKVERVSQPPRFEL
jgi:hypothetical protein